MTFILMICMTFSYCGNHFGIKEINKNIQNV